MKNLIFFVLFIIGLMYYLIQHGADTQVKEANPQESHKSTYKL